LRPAFNRPDFNGLKAEQSEAEPGKDPSASDELTIGSKKGPGMDHDL
jgi:hypothetical protein